MKTFALLLAPAALVLAHPGDHQIRQVATPAPSVPAPVASSPAVTSAVAAAPAVAAPPVTVDGNVIPAIAALTSGGPSQATSALASVPTAGTPAPFPGAPPLPDISTLSIASYPPFREVPAVNSPQVLEWMKELDGHDIPNYTPNISPTCADNPVALADTSRCWWTCHKCSKPEDVSTCPDKMSWGLTFDDGPSPETPKLLNYLNLKNQKATFYVIGSNVMARPAMLQAEYISGHEISIHGWSHTPLTTLTTPQIVAELGWTRKVIKDVIGVTPNTYRPPQGDMDNRVRAIATAMGLTAVLWTEDATGTFDSYDWHITGGLKTGQQIWDAYQAILATAETRSNGFITLQHDLHPETVNFALHVIPAAQASGKYKMTTVIDCLKKPASAAYMETSGTAPGNSTVGTNTTKPPIAKTSSGSSPGSTNAEQGTNAGVGLSSYAPAWMAASLGLVLAALLRL